jgi:nitrite reductase/ring-hydroxylating ferredoxin subunit
LDSTGKRDTLVGDDVTRNRTTEHRLTRRNCGDCRAGAPDSSRRVFLKTAGAMFGVAAFGFTGADIGALPVAFGTSVSAAGSERRYPIPSADGVTIDRASQVIVVRYQQHLYAFNLACPHENTALKWLPKDCRFQCPKHESRYQPSGQFIDGRATRNMDRLGVRVDDNMLVVDLNRFFRSDKDSAGWTAATVAV